MAGHLFFGNFLQDLIKKMFVLKNASLVFIGHPTVGKYAYCASPVLSRAGITWKPVILIR